MCLISERKDAKTQSFFRQSFASLCLCVQFYKLLLFDEFKVLIIFPCFPIAAPIEAGLGKEFEAEVVVVNLVGEVPRAVTVGLASGRLDKERAVAERLDVGVVERVDVDGQSTGMLREIVGGSNVAIAEARGIVVAHLRLVVSIIDIGQQHPLDGVLRVEQLVSFFVIRFQILMV